MQDNPRGKQADWRFDVGLDRGEIKVMAWASSLPVVKFKALTRVQLLKLRAEINSALRTYPKPEASAPLGATNTLTSKAGQNNEIGSAGKLPAVGCGKRR